MTFRPHRSLAHVGTSPRVRPRVPRALGTRPDLSVCCRCVQNVQPHALLTRNGRVPWYWKPQRTNLAGRGCPRPAYTIPMAVSSLDALGVAPEDMTPAEAKELARLMEQVRALEEGTSTTQRRETPALFTAEEKPQRTRKLQRPKSARALPVEDVGKIRKGLREEAAGLPRYRTTRKGRGQAQQRKRVACQTGRRCTGAARRTAQGRCYSSGFVARVRSTERW